VSEPVAIFSARADARRLAALGLLRGRGEGCVCELVAALGASQSRMSGHLATFLQPGLVTDRRDARLVRDRLNGAMPHSVRRLIDAALDLTETQARGRVTT